MALEGVIFDMDGTLTVPVIDFSLMRQRLGILQGDILATIRAWPHPRRAAALEIIEEIEKDARERLQIQPGALELLAYLDRCHIRKGIITRNTAHTVRHLCRVLGQTFDAVLTRDFESIKPSPEPALHMCKKLGLCPSHSLMVGDYRDDIACGRAAGMKTCLLVTPSSSAYRDMADHVAADLYEVLRIVQQISGGGSR